MKKRVDERRKKLFAVLMFILKLNALAIPAYLIMAADFSVPQIQSAFASAVSGALNSLGYHSTAEGIFIHVLSGQTAATFDISTDCTGWKSVYFLSALAIATASSMKSKLSFLAAAIPAIIALNFMRIVTTIVIAFHYGFQYLDMVHTFLWREGLIFAVIAAWLIWLWKTNYNIRNLKIGFRCNIARR